MACPYSNSVSLSSLLYTVHATDLATQRPKLLRTLLLPPLPLPPPCLCHSLCEWHCQSYPQSRVLAQPQQASGVEAAHVTPALGLQQPCGQTSPCTTAPETARGIGSWAEEGRQVRGRAKHTAKAFLKQSSEPCLEPTNPAQQPAQGSLAPNSWMYFPASAPLQMLSSAQPIPERWVAVTQRVGCRWDLVNPLPQRVQHPLECSHSLGHLDHPGSQKVARTRFQAHPITRQLTQVAPLCSRPSPAFTNLDSNQQGRNFCSGTCCWWSSAPPIRSHRTLLTPTFKNSRGKSPTAAAP